MNRIEQASEPLALIMRRQGASRWEPLTDGSFRIVVTKGGRGGKEEPYRMLPRMLEVAADFIATRVPPLRGALDPIPYNRSSGPAAVVRAGSRKHRDGRRR